MSETGNYVELFNSEARKHKIVSVGEFLTKLDELSDAAEKEHGADLEGYEPKHDLSDIPDRLRSAQAQSTALSIAPQHSYAGASVDELGKTYISGEGMGFNAVAAGEVGNDKFSKMGQSSTLEAFDACEDHRDKILSGKLVSVSQPKP